MPITKEFYEVKLGRKWVVCLYVEGIGNVPPMWIEAQGGDCHYYLQSHKWRPISREQFDAKLDKEYRRKRLKRYRSNNKRIKKYHYINKA